MTKIVQYILGVDTSCDETSAAVLENGQKILSNVISSQIKLHQPHGGVVPELASRSHTEALPYVIDSALAEAGIGLHEVNGIAVTASPGLIGCLLVGLSYAKSLAYSLGIPYTTVHHLKAHLFSPFLEQPETYPFLGLVVSGGHTAFYHVINFDEIRCLGQTVDDAAGEAFDKVAKLLGLGYPGGPVIDRLSRNGNPDRFHFTRARVKKGPYYLSFSGLKTAVRTLISNMSQPQIVDLCASFQEEVVGTLVEKVELGLEEYPIKTLAVSGGVAVNSRLRSALENLSRKFKLGLAIPSPLLCTDNGAMIAYVGTRQLQKGSRASWDSNAYASAPMW